MSGTIAFKVRPGKSKDRKFPRYVEWYWEVTSEDGKTIITVSPKYPELNALFHQIFVHEFLNDWMRGRTPDFTRKRVMFNLGRLLDDSQTDFQDHWRSPENIPMIYHKCNYSKDLED